MVTKYQKQRESQFLKLVEKIKNERVKGILLLVHYHSKELLLIALFLVIFVKKEHLKKIPFIKKFFIETTSEIKK